MKRNFIYTLFISFLAMIVFSANRNGRASTENADSTGAPFQGAQGEVCSECHGGGPASMTTITLLDSTNTQVTQYLPGKTYTARVTISTSGTPGGYGFQMVALRASDTTNIGTFTDVNPNNYKLKTLTSTQRTYAEHAGMSATNTFNVVWTAPAAGKGQVKFYAAGNAVNNNFSTSGDSPSSTQLTVNEFSVATGEIQSLDAQVFPNTLGGEISTLNVVVADAGHYRFNLLSLNGQSVYSAEKPLQSGSNTLELNAASLENGLYLLHIQNGSRSACVKIVKF